MPIEPNPYDKPELIALRKGQGDPWFLYVIVRESLGMSPGKIAAQVGHAVQLVLLRYQELSVAMEVDQPQVRSPGETVAGRRVQRNLGEPGRPPRAR